MINSVPKLINFEKDLSYDDVVFHCQCPLPIRNPDGKTGYGHLINSFDARIEGVKCSKCGQIMKYVGLGNFDESNFIRY